MKNKGLVFYLVFLWFISSSVLAEELSWQDCVNEAFRNHPDLISAKETIAQAKEDKNIAKSGLFPQVTSETVAKRSKAASQSEVSSYSYNLTGKQLLFDGFKTSADINSALATISAQEYNYAVVSSDVRLNLRNAFVELLKTQELISLSEEIAKRRTDNLELVKLRYQAGREHKGALLTAEADLAQAEFEVAQAKRNLSLSQRKLAKELGRDESSDITVKGAFVSTEGSSVRPDFVMLSETTPFLKELIAKKDAARFNLNSTKSDYLPQIYLNSTFGQSNSQWPPEDNQWSAGFSVSLPIFEGGSRKAKVSKAKSQLLQAQADERSGKDSVILTLEDTWKSFEDSRDLVIVKQKFLEAAKERAKIANAQYSTGLISFDDWVIIEDNLVSAQKSFLDAEANLLIAEANWVQAKGGILEYVEE